MEYNNYDNTEENDMSSKRMGVSRTSRFFSPSN